MVQNVSDEHSAAVLAGIQEIGFSEQSIRIVENAETNLKTFMAYRDDDFEGPANQLDLADMEYYCVKVWGNGFYPCELANFGLQGEMVAFGQAEFNNWAEG